MQTSSFIMLFRDTINLEFNTDMEIQFLIFNFEETESVW